MLRTDDAVLQPVMKPSCVRLGIIRPHPFPDELARGVKGRLMRLNGFDRECITNSILDRLYREANPDDRTRRIPIETLAFAVGMDRQSFLCQHTMLPYRRAFATLAWDEAHGSDGDPGWRVPTVLQPERSAAFLCASCVEEDLNFHGVSYWRREHQFPGRWWCGKHDRVLSFVEGRDPFLAPPAHLLGSAKQPNARLADKARRNRFVERVGHLQSELVQRRRPLSAEAVQRFLQQLCKREKLTYGRTGGARHVSGELRRAFGDQWLQDVARVQDRRRDLGAYALNLKDMPSCALALAAMAVLVGEAEDAMLVLLAAGVARPAEKRQTVRKLNADVLRRLYIKHCGVHKKVADNMGVFPASVKYRLDRLGLPTLTGASLAQLRRDLSAFATAGEALAVACEGDATRLAALEAALRGTATNLLSATAIMVPLDPSKPKLKSGKSSKCQGASGPGSPQNRRQNAVSRTTRSS